MTQLIALGVVLLIFVGGIVWLALKQPKSPLIDEMEHIPLPEPQKTPVGVSLSLQIYNEAHNWLGKDASPKNLAPQELACSESVCTILHEVIPDFPLDIVSTATLAETLFKSPYFFIDTVYEPGTIIVSPRSELVHGHCGIFLAGGRIASNDSRGGLFEDNYSLDGWVQEMRVKRGLKILYFRPVDNGKV